MSDGTTYESAPALTEESAGMRLLLVALAGVLLFHGGLLPFTHANTYDAFIHMFFGDSYHRSWFDTWEPRWYTGFATTSYPPGTHMAIGALMYIVPLRAAFVIVQIFGLSLLTVGVYRFSMLWVSPRAAGYSAIALVLSSSISETIHLFGQLPTICSLGIFLNGLPYVYRWITFGKLTNFAAAVTFTAATTAAHHVTTIFGGVLFILPLGLQALRAVSELHGPGETSRIRRAKIFIAPLTRGVVLAAAMLAAIVLTVFPYWYWSINDPITQVPIPHGSRESFIERTDLGFVFFVLPWGTSILFLPYVIYKTATTRLWPLGLSVLLCFVLGTGGTTPIPRAILHGAFDILTLDRFTFWATILILPFLGHMIDGLLHGRSSDAIREALGKGLHRALVSGIFISMTMIAVFAAILPTFRLTQPRFIDPTPITQFLAVDEHDRWRYLTLGFGDQFAYMSAQTTAESVDGNYHSARRLPDMTRFSVERLENAKYLGVPGLGSLKQFLVNADKYHLKYVFSNDEFYDPLLHFTGWTRLNRLANGITVWEKPDVTPLPVFRPRREIPRVHMLMWGTLPPTALVAALTIFFWSAFGRNFGAKAAETRPLLRRERAFRHPILVRRVVHLLGVVAIVGAISVIGYSWEKSRAVVPAERVIDDYFAALDFRKFDTAYAKLDPKTRPDFDDVMFQWRWRGGLLASFGKLAETRITKTAETDTLIDWAVELDWLTALNLQTEILAVRTVLRGQKWFVVPTTLRPVQTPVLLQRDAEVAWNVTGRRQPRPETDLHRDRLDRPRIALGGTRLVEHHGRYSLIGVLSNTDSDPAVTSVFGDLQSDGGSIARQASGRVNGQRLLPAETTGFRVDFEGVLSLEDEATAGGFDPTLFIPPELSSSPTEATIDARALVGGRDMYRDVALNNIQIKSIDGQPVVTALAVNTGTQSATITRVIALLYDEAGDPIWTDAGFVETNMYPGQSAPFKMTLPARNEIAVVYDILPEDITVNGSTMQADLSLPDGTIGTIELRKIPGYSALRLHVSTMTYDPLF